MSTQTVRDIRVLVSFKDSDSHDRQRKEINSTGYNHSIQVLIVFVHVCVTKTTRNQSNNVTCNIINNNTSSKVNIIQYCLAHLSSRDAWYNVKIQRDAWLLPPSPLCCSLLTHSFVLFQGKHCLLNDVDHNSLENKNSSRNQDEIVRDKY